MKRRKVEICYDAEAGVFRCHVLRNTASETELACWVLDWEIESAEWATICEGLSQLEGMVR